MMRRSFAAVLLVCVSLFSNAATYYVSHNGNDSNSGTSESQAWRSISRVLQMVYTLQPGDHILFERGGMYPGTLDLPISGTSSQPIVVGAYGSGEQPIISGGVPVTNWVQHSGNIWRASLLTEPKYILVNNQPMTLARYPNTGYLRNQQGTNTQLVCPDLNQSGGTWTGGTLHIRTTNWCYEKATITSSSSNGTITFEPLLNWLGSEDWGFFITGKLSQLDMAGEWFWDQSSNQLYLWAPNNANPNNLSVLASIHEKGIVPFWQRSHLRIENITLQGQTNMGISTEVANNVVVTNCTFRHSYRGIVSTGHSNLYTNNTFENTFGTAVVVYDVNTTVEDNIFNNIAVNPGMGETQWGYFAINTTGNGTIVRGNRLNNIGYIGICAAKDQIIEKNVVINATSILNDGAGIAFDHADGLQIRDNIVMDCIGNLESVATNHISYFPICFGIYFGNTSIKNTVVERNTVKRCNGAGLHVDHTMVSTGNQVKDNVLFDNDVQLSISDYSNYHGPGATQPYHVPSFNTIYSGNLMYSVREDQLCMRQYHVYSANMVDFGTFNNNKYFHPYQEMSIMVRNSIIGGNQYFTLERYQSVFNKDLTSTRHPLRQTMLTTQSELSADLITNGDFSAPVNNWTMFPTNGQISIDHTYLDNGAMKVNLPNNSQYNSLHLRSPDQFSIQNGQWYRMRLSVQSDIHGIMEASVKGASQGPTSVIGGRSIPFSPERRDLEFYFQSGLSDQAHLQLVNHFQHPRYWIDNVQLHRVNVQEVDPLMDHVILVNDFTVTQSFSLPSGCWSDVNGNVLDSDVSVPSYSSRVIYRIPGTGCSETPQTHTLAAKVVLGGALLANGTMRTSLLAQGVLPSSEPYTGMGYSLVNSGQQVSSSLMQATGTQAIVDWVVLELRDAGSYSVAERRAALVRANGEVVSADGASLITFDIATQGRHLAVHHRNHLSIMTASPLSTNGQMVDLTTSSTSTYGSGARMTQGSIRGMWPGDVNGDGMVSYTNANNDRDMILVAIGSVIPSQTASGYLVEDVNLDGVSKYTGSSNDRDLILTTIGGTVPTAVRLSQMP